MYPGEVVQKIIAANPNNKASKNDIVTIHLVFKVNDLVIHMKGIPKG